MAELPQKIDELGRAFEAFKAANDQRLFEIEKNGRARSDLEEKIDRIGADLDKLEAEKDRLDKIEAALNRGQFGGGGNSDLGRAKKEHAAAFARFCRKGVEDGLRDLEIRAELSTDSDPDGGWVVTEEVDREISRVQGTMSQMRNLARVRPVGGKTYSKLVNVGGTSSGWVGEKETRSETNTPVLKKLDFPTMEVYAEPHATQAMLDDAWFDVGMWLADEVGVEFVEKEGAAFITGTGINQPRGITQYSTVADASYAWGSVGYIASGAAGAFAASNPADKLIDLQDTLKAGYQNGAVWLMRTATKSTIRKFKDGNGQYILRQGLEAGAPTTILEKPVHLDDNMPAIAANSLSIAYGDFRRGYVITDRMGVRVLRDPYTAKPYIKFYTTKRVGGGIENFEAIKLMKFAAS